MQDVPHINSVCMMLNKDNAQGKIEGSYTFNRYYKVVRQFAPNSKKKHIIHKAAVKPDYIDTDDTAKGGKPKEKKDKKDKEEKKAKKVKKDKKEKKDKKDKEEKKAKKVKKDKKEKKDKKDKEE
eukprot:CAMPEP_0205808750 /NCGR_PEP_ID=MMETSP0205-20121125/12784_1 /ASSEMBLY_ACC=CAM_ASM_000278 /TAXON_ID=36767 /ORGANISM="Euplotes focardii, Strain TN1" /LENGTH=123 /DNA_ID=CAMNT_0053084901 /DNA_START=129 /DNA_END=497 /DNA_ORIENTATION=-